MHTKQAREDMPIIPWPKSSCRYAPRWLGIFSGFHRWRLLDLKRHISAPEWWELRVKCDYCSSARVRMGLRDEEIIALDLELKEIDNTDA